MMTPLREHLQRRGEVEALAWARIQPMRNGVELARGVARQIRALGQVLAQQAMGVLSGPALPGAVRIGNEDLDREPLGPPRMFRPLVATIIGQRFPQRGRHVPEFSREARSTRVPTAEPFRAPLMRSPSQWSGTVRLATSAGRSAIGVMLGIWPRQSVPRDRGRRALRA